MTKSQPEDQIEWADPPPRITTRGAGKAQRFVEALKARPGEWAKYPDSLSSASAPSVYKKANPGTEWTARKRDDGRYDVFARWVGP